MAKGDDYIPNGNVDFYNWQKTMVTYASTRLVGWGIAPGDFTPITTEQAIYDPLYQIFIKKGQRNSGDITDHNDERKIYEKLLRDFVKGFIASNKKVTNAQREAMKITVPDTTRSQRPKIDTEPIVNATSASGARVKIECRVAKDQTRPSMHPDADAVEARYIVATTAPANPAACSQVTASSKARFKIENDIADAGKKIYGFCRWKNNSDNSKSSPWSKMFTVTITE